MSRLIRVLAALTALVATPLAAQVQWRAGPLIYTPAYDFTLGYTPNGTGYFVSQAYIPSPPQPSVNSRSTSACAWKASPRPASGG